LRVAEQEFFRNLLPQTSLSLSGQQSFFTYDAQRSIYIKAQLAFPHPVREAGRK
jgi:hypothetical protein